MTDLSDIHIVCDLTPSTEDVARVRSGLMQFNEAAIGLAHVQLLAFFLKNEARDIRGGLVGYLAWQWLTVDLLWVDEPLRGRSWGAALLRHAEDAARRAGCPGARLDTHEFQARPFYERHGYQVWGVLEGYPHGSRSYYMRKSLGPSATSEG